MGLVEDVGEFLDAASTRFDLGTRTFLNYLPEQPNRAHSVTETGGLAPTHVFGSTSAAWENARVQILTRSTSSVTARADIEAAFTILDGVQNQTVNGSTFLRIAAVQSPFLVNRDERGRVIFSCNFQCWRRR